MRSPEGAISARQLQSDLVKLGTSRGIVLVVHTSLRNVGWVAEGLEGVIWALREVIGDLRGHW